MFKIALGILIPFIGTTLGSALVFTLKRNMSSVAKSGISGFAGGVMTAASVWSLLIPAINQSAGFGSFAFFPALVGFFIGVFFLYIIDKSAPVSKSGEKKALPLAITIHNFPEGMAVGVAYAGVLLGSDGITLAGAFALSMGVAIQNFPEGAIISMPMHAGGVSKFKSFIAGTLSGAVEPLGALLLLIASGVFAPVLPYILGFAAGAMIYVVVKELVPEATALENNCVGVIAFTVGFAIMMTLDVALS